MVSNKWIRGSRPLINLKFKEAIRSSPILAVAWRQPAIFYSGFLQTNTLCIIETRSSKSDFLVAVVHFHSCGTVKLIWEGRNSSLCSAHFSLKGVQGISVDSNPNCERTGGIFCVSNDSFWEVSLTTRVCASHWFSEFAKPIPQIFRATLELGKLPLKKLVCSTIRYHLDKIFDRNLKLELTWKYYPKIWCRAV